MSRMNRRRFTWVATSGLASAALVACSGEAVKDDLTPTRISDVEGAPPTLAPNATPFSSEEAGGGEATEPASGGGGGTEPITVTGLDSLAYDPSSFEASPGQTIHFINGGVLEHDLNIDELGLDGEVVGGGEEYDLVIPDDAEIGAEYVFYCSVPGHREGGMEGTVTIVEAGASGGGEEQAASEEQAAAGGGGEAVTVEALDALQFDPSEFEIAPGQDIHVVNSGALQHDFVCDELGIATDLLNGGDEQTITVPEDAEVGQSYTYYCSVPGHREAGMEGTLTIVEGGGGGEAAAGEEQAAATEEPAAAAEGGGEAITVNALDALQFDPSEIEAAPGQEIHVVNTGAMQHDFVVDELGIATELLNGGEEETVTVPDDAEVGQSYTYYCSVPGHRQAGMEGTITIVEGGGGAAATDQTQDEAAEEAGASQDAAASSQGGGAVTVEASDSLQFNPAELSVAPGGAIHIINVGALQHDFVIDEWGLATPLLNGGQEITISIPAHAEAGRSVTYYCSVPGHREAGMQGTLTVAEGEGATPEAAATPSVEVDPNAIRVAALDSMKFAPRQFSAAPGQQVHLVNPGVLVHDIVIDEWGVDSGALTGGQEAVFNIPDDVEVGAEVTFYCSVPGHRESGMEGTITIVESAEAAEATPVADGTPAEQATPAGEASPAAATPAEDAGDGGGETEVTVHAIDIAYEETELTFPADTDVSVTLVNEGVLQHDFNIEDTEFATELLNAGQETTITVNLPAGEYTYFCSVPGHREAGMEGTLTVE